MARRPVIVFVIFFLILPLVLTVLQGLRLGITGAFLAMIVTALVAIRLAAMVGRVLDRIRPFRVIVERVEEEEEEVHQSPPVPVKQQKKSSTTRERKVHRPSATLPSYEQGYQFSPPTQGPSVEDGNVNSSLQYEQYEQPMSAYPQEEPTSPYYP